jgi:predicted methyltransferase
MRSKHALVYVAAFGRLALAPAVAGPALQAVDPVIAQAVQNTAIRSPKFIARDATRHPAEELSFFGLRPDATVVEIWPAGGYWSEILASYLHGRGSYYVAVPGGPDGQKNAAAFHARVQASPVLFVRATITELGVGKTDIAPPGSADFVLTFRNVHNWMADGTADANFAAFYKALKPGGILGVEEHRGRADKPQDPKAENGYVREDYTIALAQKAGFTLVGKSEINANPKDTKEWPKGVWTLPPTFALGAKDHAKYAAIGEADNFVLKFRK